MEGPSSSTLDDLRRQLHKYNRLVDEELDKVEGRDQVLVAQYEKRVENLIAQINLASGSSSGIARDIHDIREMVQTMQLVTAIQNARLSPWCDASSASSAPSTSDFKDALVETYQLEVHHDADKRQYQKCQVTQEVMLSGATVAAHLFPRRATHELAAIWGLVDHARDVRNGLVWFAGIEKAWTDKQVCLQHDAEGTLRFRVLSLEIWDRSPVELCDYRKGQHATQALHRMNFSDLDGRAVFFPDGVAERPYQRVVVSQAADAITTQWKLGKLRPELELFNLDVLSDFANKETVSAWVKTTMVQLPHWPLGPEAETQLQSEVVNAE